MRQKLYQIMIAFMAAWTMAGIFQEPHRQAIVYSFCCALSYAIYIGLHTDIFAIFKRQSPVTK